MVNIDDKLACFIANIPVNALAEQIALQSKDSVGEIEAFLDLFINEMHGALDIVKPYLDLRLSLLEVGAGLCFFSLFLRSENYNITALEPVAGGFDRFTLAKAVILDHYHELDLSVLDKKAQDLLPQNDGYFDFVFSNNVIEHIPELDRTLAAIAKVMSRQGKMVHGCPNYTVPYEPHFQIPVLKCWPGLSERLYAKRLDPMTELWRSLNFITYFDVRAFAKGHKMQLKLRKGLIHQAFVRLGQDSYFRERQSGKGLWYCYLLLKKTGLLRLLKYWPACLATPMIIELSALLDD
ncbi:MAG: methyltransferase domain-containing protein [Colwellia sp.]|jgi:Methyltransferase domain.